MLLEDTYNQLRFCNVVNNAYEFSTDFLGKNKTYYSVLKTRRQEPSVDTLIYLEIKLADTASFYKRYNYPHFKRTYNHLTKLINRLNNSNKAVLSLLETRKQGVQ